MTKFISILIINVIFSFFLQQKLFFHNYLYYFDIFFCSFFRSFFRSFFFVRCQATTMTFKRHVGKDYNLVVIKCKLKSIVRPEFRNLVKDWIGQKSISATKICDLGSMLFFSRAQAAFDDGIRTKHFDTSGEQEIRSCFFSVSYNRQKAMTIPNEFQPFTQNMVRDGYREIEWPKRDYFGNINNVLIETYSKNVQTNLNTHLVKRLREFLRMRVYEISEAVGRKVYDDNDISNTIDLALGKEDRVTDQNRRTNRENLMQIIREYSWYDIANDNVAEFTKEYWYQSIPMWLAMQREIAQFNTDAGYREERRGNRREWRLQQREMRKNKRKNIVNDSNKPPFIKNLAVIPICSPQRTYITFGNVELYNMMCESGCCPKNENGKQIIPKDVIASKQHYWEQIFNLPKIKRLGKRKKQFHYAIETDGVSVSILYEKKKTGSEAMLSTEEIIRRYHNGEFVYECGIDPGMKTWNATVRRTIATGKEVNLQRNYCSLFLLANVTNIIICIHLFLQ